ncbi:MAG: glycosyltransferase [Thermoflexales bacterium]|nr:glycosyltransferase [Thermoflexales bacterium]
MLRVVKPLVAAGFEFVRGNEWNGQKTLIRSELVEQADVIFIQRDFAIYAEEYDAVVARARSAGKPIVYDIDDLLFDLPEDHPAFPRYQQCRTAILRAAAEADLVTVSTQALRIFLSPFNPSIRVLPNCLPDDLWQTSGEIRRPEPFGEAEGLRIGFIGSNTHTADLDLIAEAIIEVLKAYPSAKFISWGCPLPGRLASVGEFVPLALVRYADFTSFVRGLSCDIVVAPLIESTFNACKSALKFLEYGALGFAGVYSAWGEFSEVILDGETGLLAASIARWREHLLALAADQTLRSRIGQKARVFVQDQRMLSKNAWRWREALTSIQASQALPRYASAALAVAAKWHAYDTRLLRDSLHKSETEVHRLESELGSLRQAYEESQRKLQWAEQKLAVIESGPGWQLLAKIWPIRRALIPPGSVRERAFKQLVAKLTGNSPQLFSSSPSLPPVSVSSSSQTVTVSTGQTQRDPQCPDLTPPEVSLVVLAEPDEARSVMPWIAAQTWKADEVLFYSHKEQQAYDLETGRRYQAHSLPILLESSKGRYIGFVTKQHTALPATYVEQNVIALESERIAFAVNASVAQIVGRLNTGLSLSSLFLRKERLCSGERADLCLCVNELSRGAVGKVIPSRLVLEDQLEIQLKLDIPVTLKGNYVVGGEALSPAVSLCPFDQLSEVVPHRFSSKPVVVIVFPFIAVGGAERIALDMMRFLKHEIDFVVVATDPALPNTGSMVDLFREVVARTYVLEDFLHPENRIPFFRYLVRTLSPQVLYVANGSTWIYDSLLTFIRVEFPSVRIVNQVYDHMFGWIERYDSEFAKRIDAHIGTNRSICGEYARRGAPEKSIYLVEHGIDTEEFDPARYSPEDLLTLRHKFGIPDGKRVVTFIARFHQQKRPMDFVELGRSLQNDERLFFLMVGDGPLSQVVEDEVRRIGLKNFRRMGFYQPSRDIFAVSDLIVLPSEYEGMPLVILEAQSMGKPVVATNVGNNREVLELTGGGIVVPRVGDTRALQRAVLDALDRPFNGKKMREAVRSHFDWRVIALKYRKALLGE